MWTNSQTPARRAARRCATRPMSATAAARPIVARSPCRDSGTARVRLALRWRARMFARRVRALLDRRRRDARARACRPARPRRGRRSRTPRGGRARSGRARRHAARAVERHAEAARRAARPRRPRPRAPSARRCARSPSVTPRRRSSVTARAGRHLDAERLSWRVGARDSSSGNAASKRGPASTRITRACARIDVAEVARERVARDLGERARELDAGRPAADDHEREPAARRSSGRARARPPRTRAGCGGGSRARPRCVLRPGATLRPLVVAEVRVRRAGGDDQVVVGELAVASSSTRSRWRGRSPCASASSTLRVAAAGAGSRGSARRCRAGRARRSRPDTAAAETGGGCGGRSA